MKRRGRLARATVSARLRRAALTALLLGLAPPAGVHAQEEAPRNGRARSDDPRVAWQGTLVPARTFRAEGWDWDHEVRVWLPPSYHATDRSYPVIWVLDNALERMMAGLHSAGFSPEVIVVAVGAPPDITPAEFQRRRSYDFIPSREEMSAAFAQLDIGGAPGFLDFLVRQLRPALSEEYRMDPADHGLAGHSGGAQFALYTLFHEPRAFARYLISSPAAYEPWLRMEEEWRARHDDLPARVFLSAGEAEATHPVWAGMQIVSTVALLAERLATRAYPSLELQVKIFEDEEHVSVWPIAYSTACATSGRARASPASTDTVRPWPGTAPATPIVDPPATTP